MKNLTRNLHSRVMLLTSAFMVIIGLNSNEAFAQCSNCGAQFPGATQSTTSNSLVTVSTCVYGGEYAVYNVTAGETYTWTTCGDTDFDTQLTLWSGATCSTGFLAYNDDDCGLQSTITWVATFTGQVNLLVSRYNCANQSTCMTVQWACLTCGVVANPPADYLMPTTGINSEYVGACLVADCGPSILADDGGTNGNYANSTNFIYRTFCPDAAGQCMSVTFDQFETFNNQDFLLVKNGPTQNSPDFTTPPNSPTAYVGITGLHSDLNASTPFSFTSTDASGCLTFRMFNNNTSNDPGFMATLQCTPCAGGPNGTDNNDCMNFTPICSSANITSNASGPGIVAEGCTGTACPAGGENHTNWYSFTVQTGGNLNFTINPQDNTDDYDYAIYGPNVTCGALGNPIRCSDSGIQGNTGLQNVSPNQNIEDVNGDGWTETMTVTAGDQYFLVIDEWSPNAGSGYDLSFSGTASLDCTILPVELSEFTAEYQPEYNMVDLTWITDSERDNDRFELEKSTDGVNYEIIHVAKGAGTTNLPTQYIAVDPNPSVGPNYYRLNQWDINGNGKYSEVRSVNVLDDVFDMLSVFPNPTTGITEVIFNSYTKEEVMLNVVGYDGKIVVNAPLNAIAGGNRFDLDLTGQKAGVYFITISTTSKVYRAKLIKN